MGDYLLSRGLLLSLQHHDYFFLHSTSLAVKRMSEGELLQIQKSRQLNIDENTYIKIISDKTASLFSACTEIGAASSTENQDTRNLLKSFGENIGLAFQIRDDVLDYLGRRTILGKPTGGDIKERKITLPLIYALQKSDRSTAKRALHIIKSGAKQKDISWVVDFVQSHGGIEYALQKASFFAEEARKSLATFPHTPSKTALLQFVDFVVNRDH